MCVYVYVCCVCDLTEDRETDRQTERERVRQRERERARKRHGGSATGGNGMCKEGRG